MYTDTNEKFLLQSLCPTQGHCCACRLIIPSLRNDYHQVPDVHLSYDVCCVCGLSNCITKLLKLTSVLFKYVFHLARHTNRCQQSLPPFTDVFEKLQSMTKTQKMQKDRLEKRAFKSLLRPLDRRHDMAGRNACQDQKRDSNTLALLIPQI